MYIFWCFLYILEKKHFLNKREQVVFVKGGEAILLVVVICEYFIVQVWSWMTCKQ